MKDLFSNYVKYFNFKDMIIGVDGEIKLKELFFYMNRQKLKKM